MKAWQKIILIIGIMAALYLSPPASTVSAAQERFSDLNHSRWAEDSIHYLAQRGTIAGYGNGQFKPSSSITRAQAVTYLIREMYPDRKYTMSEVQYRDLPRTHMFYGEVAVATSLGLIGGFDDGTFRPDAPISRAETAAILSRFYKLEPGSEPSSKLTDINEHWASEPILLLASNGLVGGYADATFRPNRSVSRAEYAVFLTRIIRFERAHAIQSHNWDKLLPYMTIKEKVGQMLMPDIRMWAGKPSYSINAGVSSMLYDQQPGGLILFNKNIVDVEQLTTFNHQLQQQSGDIPLFLSMDQEGGVVNRIPGGTNLPGNMALGATGQPELALHAGKITGTELRALGVNLNFAPVLDINVNPDNPIIGIRSFGSDPELVTNFGMKFMQGLQQSGVIPAVKHFPGHGDTTVDSHLGLPVVTHDRQRLEEIELKPFRAAIRSGADMVMSAHIAYTALDDTKMKSKKDGSDVPLPATLSRKVMTGLLREELGFQGVIVSDAFTMDGIAAHFGEEEAVKLAVQAGVDIILMPKEIAGAHQAIVQAVNKGEITVEQIDASVKRILSLKQKYDLFQREGDLPTKLLAAKQIIGASEHRQMEKSIAEQAITELSNDNNRLPYRMKDGDRIAILAQNAEHAALIKSQLSVTDLGKRYTVETLLMNGNSASDISASMQRANFVILASYQFRRPILEHNWAQYQTLVNELNASSKPYVLLSLGNPYEGKYLHDVQAGIAAYGAQQPNVLAALKVILGVNEAKGTLPVN
ncbi:Beta-hexosaminidase [Paenibacillus plantiphilus]|uniref:beta-N-acetylhexosaminidase n=1 Tax=Paenibacillus plantiphilus TaxID=2905650 RepID=A0ABN8GPI8_9BACL|nr:glycoside hydrolase family 3 N-terminal domain-containing protein [Paenibacillus plantiphilus]CAH1214570.1 Beta-hexosaminidase [Paenibacillus plantiphilus]